jgi:hypothetical protein
MNGRWALNHEFIRAISPDEIAPGRYEEPKSIVKKAHSRYFTSACLTGSIRHSPAHRDKENCRLKVTQG